MSLCGRYYHHYFRNTAAELSIFARVIPLGQDLSTSVLLTPRGRSLFLVLGCVLGCLEASLSSTQQHPNPSYDNQNHFHVLPDILWGAVGGLAKPSLVEVHHLHKINEDKIPNLISAISKCMSFSLLHFLKALGIASFLNGNQSVLESWLVPEPISYSDS